ncbi:hypothetical protein WG66_016845 [Moniliophthora roreri]|nr:hypothetical protein WG66_016845 [Moniliophthora roreri]
MKLLYIQRQRHPHACSGNERLETSSVALFDLLVFGAQGPQGTRDGVPEQSNQEILDPVRTLVVDYHPISTISAESAIYVTSSPRAETVSSRIAFTNNHVFLGSANLDRKIERRCRRLQETRGRKLKERVSL